MHTETHHTFMQKALQLAERGRYSVSPNPMVGCVITNQNDIVGTGYHVRAGDAHAEVLALQEAGVRARGATVYVTLEPCCHHGRTPPCVNALIKAGVKKVYAACLDPNPLVSGQGVKQLRAAGIEVDVGLGGEQAAALNEIFFHFITHRKPFVIAKWAMSLDGKTITHPTDDRMISGTASHQTTHALRQQVDAVLISGKTAIADNPQLTVRELPAGHTVSKQPLRVILAGKQTLPLDLHVLNDTSIANTLVVVTEETDKEWLADLHKKPIKVMCVQAASSGRVHLPALLDALGRMQITSLLVEGGMTLLQHFFKENLINKMHVYVAPVIIGEQTKKQPLIDMQYQLLDSDLHITAKART